ncbi:MAG: hypothetical protein H6736_17305 [Alphaproteobacteria bacterium]|nr:hypothetical protein [Alphaproteobacteria bacterium]MCB9693572.1 hypothetical protein [Alphaproteobacteria bacterium]
MIRSMQANQRGRGGKAGGKAGKRTLGDGARDALHAAGAKAAAGEHGAAATAYAELARIAESRGRPGAAAHIAVQGALAALAGGDRDQALAIAREGVTLASGVADQRRVARKFVPFIDALSRDDADAAAAFREEAKKGFGLKLIPAPGETVTPNRAQRRSLPKACGTCGEPVDSATVVFQDDGTCDCALCGDPIAG